MFDDVAYQVHVRGHNDSWSSDSGKSESDEELEVLKPKPVKINSKDVVVVDNRSKTVHKRSHYFSPLTTTYKIPAKNLKHDASTYLGNKQLHQEFSVVTLEHERNASDHKHINTRLYSQKLDVSKKEENVPKFEVATLSISSTIHSGILAVPNISNSNFQYHFGNSQTKRELVSGTSTIPCTSGSSLQPKSRTADSTRVNIPIRMSEANYGSTIMLVDTDKEQASDEYKNVNSHHINNNAINSGDNYHGIRNCCTSCKDFLLAPYMFTFCILFGLCLILILYRFSIIQ